MSSVENGIKIPLYLDKSFLEDTIIAVKIVEGKKESLNKRIQDTITINVPISEIIPPRNFGFIQGDLKIQRIKECTKSVSEKNVVNSAIDFNKFMSKKNIIKNIKTNFDINKINVSEYIIFSSKIYLTPIYKYASEILNKKNMGENILKNNLKLKTEGEKKQINSYIEKYMTSINNSNSKLYFGELCDVYFFMNLDKSNFTGHFDNIEDVTVRIIGKVISTEFNYYKLVESEIENIRKKINIRKSRIKGKKSILIIPLGILI